MKKTFIVLIMTISVAGMADSGKRKIAGDKSVKVEKGWASKLRAKIGDNYNGFGRL